MTSQILAGIHAKEECACVDRCNGRHGGACFGHVRTCAGCGEQVCWADGADDVFDTLLSAVVEVRRHGGDGGLCDECAARIIEANEACA